MGVVQISARSISYCTQTDCAMAMGRF